ncbi:transporter [Amylolactobacillus amylophilus DSM 20533 = JCM 1125]|uniref:Transporter n=1 Tax=Amylolactobacillus amylophilus DSM 20533 = JCM 1125 TaxID=1423721 RepID=A0A1L6XEF2_9LACO|nr:transporter [Amylolactobacillus amylophilus DSM 20533 = JCM 1125]
MNNLSRTKASVVNSSVATIAQIIQLIFQFIARSVFIYTLGSKYLGLNGLFLNVLGYLNFAELGIGSAITFSLYRPLNNHDDVQVSAVLHLFRKIYHYIALVVLVAGLVITPFVPRLIGGSTNGINVSISKAFLLALSNTVLSYFTTYKRTLLIADQKSYVNTINTVGFNVAGQCIQIIQLLIWNNFYAYLFIQVLMMLASNIRISYVVDHFYPTIDFNSTEKVDPKVIQYLKKNIVGMFSAKLGGILVTGTDNILLSYYVGLIAVGMYSNYVMIINGLTMLINQLVSAVSASIGNLGVSRASKEHQERIFYQYFMITSLIALLASTGFSGFASAFVKLWISDKMVYSFLPLTIISLNFYLQMLRQSIINYTNAYGLYWYERWKTLFEAGVNLIISWYLIRNTNLGISGVLLGTIASNLIVNYIWESHIVLKYGLHTEEGRFLRLYAGFISVGSIIIVGTTSIINYFAGPYLWRSILVTICAEIFAVVAYTLVTIFFYPKAIEKIDFKRIFCNTFKHF